MELYLVRHAIAEPRTEELEDEARVLTPEGARKLEKSVRGLGAIDVRFDRIRHSPWARAAQTAELLVPLLDGETEVDPLLARPPGPELVASLAGDRLALVGHEPWLGQLAALLVTGSAKHGARFVFKKGGVAWLTGEPKAGAMQLAGLWQPGLLRSLG